jgi:hypothetical protein
MPNIDPRDAELAAHEIDIPLAFYEWLATVEKDVRVHDLTPSEMAGLLKSLRPEPLAGSGVAGELGMVKHAFNAGWTAHEAATDPEAFAPYPPRKLPDARELYLCSLADRNLALRAHPAPEQSAHCSGEVVEVVAYPVAERAFHVVKRFGEDDAVTFCASDRATMSTFPASDRDDAYMMADALNRVVAFHVGRAIAALSAPRPDEGVDR